MPLVVGAARGHSQGRRRERMIDAHIARMKEQAADIWDDHMGPPAPSVT